MGLTSYFVAFLLAHSMAPVQTIIELYEELSRSVILLNHERIFLRLTLLRVTGFSGVMVLKKRFMDF